MPTRGSCAFDSLARWRRDLLANLHGKVLELGVRAGPNFRFYPPEANVIALDVDWNTLRQTARAYHSLRQSQGFLLADAQRLPFPDHTFDAVVATLVFCSIPDPRRAMAEIARVLRPEGHFHAIEHTRIDVPILGHLMDILTPPWKFVTGGCHLNRRTEHTLEAAGFKIQERRQALLGVMRWLVAAPPDVAARL